MRRLRLHASYANVASTAALVLALGGGAYAAVDNPFTGPGGTIQACVGKHGALIVVRPGRSCPHGKRSLELNQTGATGPRGLGTIGAQGGTGAQGATGAQGTTGPIGPSNAYFGSSNTTLASLSLPAGDYAVFGTVDYTNPNTTGNDAGGCSLQINNGPGTITATTPFTTIPTTAAGNGAVELTDQGVAHLPGPSSIINNCYATLSGTTANTAITAIRVSAALP
jgi:hypothetical protein